MPLRNEISLPKVLHALGDPVRMEIVLKIARAGQVACGAFDIPMPKSTLSHHFKVLRESGVVASRREGNVLINSVRFDDLEIRFPGVIDAIISAAGSVLPHWHQLVIDPSKYTMVRESVWSPYVVRVVSKLPSRGRMPKSRRLQRYRDFQKFSDESKDLFNGIAEADSRNEFFGGEYSLCITPGGAYGGRDNH